MYSLSRFTQRAIAASCILSITGSMHLPAIAIQEVDPLKHLVDELSVPSEPTPKAWLEVLETQSQQTTSDLWTVLSTDGATAEIAQYTRELKAIATYSAQVSAQDLVSVAQWKAWVRINIQILDLIGKSEQLNQLITLLESPATHSPNARAEYRIGFMNRPLTDAIVACIGRDDRAMEATLTAFGECDESLARVLLRALGESHHFDSANALCSLLGQRPAMDAIVLNQVSRGLRTPSVRVREMNLKRIRNLLNPNRPLVCQAAARALGFADDVPSIAQLIDFLPSSDVALREEALRSLHRITAMTLDGHPDRWVQWFQEERHWWDTRAAQALNAIEASHPKHIAELLRELASKRLYRREITPRIAHLLKSKNDPVVRLTIAAIDSLRPPIEVIAEDLVPLLDHRSEQIRLETRTLINFLGGDVERLRLEFSRPQPK